MAILITPPDPIGFSKNKIVWSFFDDGDGMNYSVMASNAMVLAGPIPEGTIIPLRWGEKDLRLTASDNPRTDGTQFPAGLGNAAHAEALAEWLQNNFFIDESFHLVASEIGGQPAVYFEAKDGGDDYNLLPANFVGGDIRNLTEGKNPALPPNRSVYVEVWMERDYMEYFDKIYTGTINTVNGRVDLDVADILHAHLTNEIPDLFLPQAIRCKKSARRYYIRYASAGGENYGIGQISETEKFRVLRGGTGGIAGQKSVDETLKGDTPAEDRLLMLQDPVQYLRFDEPLFVSWVNLRAEQSNVWASVTITFDDPDEPVATTNTPNLLNVQPGEKVMFAVHYGALNLDTYTGAGKNIKEYTVQLLNNASQPISEPVRVIMDYSIRQYVRYFAHINSYGAFEIVKTYGKGSSLYKVMKEQAEQLLPVNYSGLDATFSDWNHTFQSIHEVATGWVPKRYLAHFLDMFLAPDKYRIFKGQLYAININSDSIQHGTDGENLHGFIFEYAFSRQSDSLTELDIELMEDDAEVSIPPGIITAGDVHGGGLPSPLPPWTGTIDNFPTSGSNNPVSSGGVWSRLYLKQDKIDTGTNLQFMLGDGTKLDIDTLLAARERDPTVPAFAKSLQSALHLLNALKTVDGEGSGLDAERLNGRTIQEIQEAEGHTLGNLDAYDSQEGLPENTDNVLQAIAKLKNIIKVQTNDQHPLFVDVPTQYVIKSLPLDYDTDLRHFVDASEDYSDLEIVSVNFHQKVEGLTVIKKPGLVLHFTGLVTTDIVETENPLLVVVRRKSKPNSQIIVPVPVATVMYEDEIPDWLASLDITYSVDTHDCTIYAETTRNIEMRVEANIGNHPNGLNHAGEIWDLNNWNPGTTDWVSAPYTELFRFNPWGIQQGGLLPDTDYIATFRREDQRNVFYQVPFRTPAVNVITPESILPEPPPVLPACPAGPDLLGITAITNTSLSFNFHGNGVDEIKWELLQGAAVKQLALVSPTSSVVPITFGYLEPGSYTLRIQGSKCASTPSSLVFTVAGAQTSSFTLSLYRNGSLHGINYQGGNLQLPFTSFNLVAVKPNNPNFGFIQSHWFVKKPDNSWTKLFWETSAVASNHGAVAPVGAMGSEFSLINPHDDTSQPATRYYYEGEGWNNATAKNITDPAEYRIEVKTRSGNFESPFVEERTIFLTVSNAPAPSATKHSVLTVQSPNTTHKVRMITGGRIDIQISNDGAISDVYPDMYSGSQRRLEILGQWYNVYYTINGLLMGNLNGVILPNGDYFIEKYYALASFFPTAEAMKNMTWELKNDRVAHRPTVQLTVGEGIFPPTYYPYFLTDGTAVSGNKVSGYKMQFANYTHAQMYAHGSTHDLDTGGGDPAIPSERKFSLIKLATTGLTEHSSDAEYYQSGRNYCIARGRNPMTLIFEEFSEELDNRGETGRARRHAMQRAWFDGYRDEMQTGNPGIQIHEFHTYGNYGGLVNLGEPGRIRTSPARLDMYRTHLSSTSQARKYYNPGTGQFESGEHDYFSSGEYNSQNVCIRMYYFNAENMSGDLLPHFIFKSQKMYIAASDRSQIVFGWELVQDMINTLSEKNGFWYFSESPAGRLYVGGNPLDVMPPFVGYWIGFFSCLLMRGFAIWSDRSGIDDVPVSGNQTSIFGRNEGGTWYDTGWDKKWKPDGGAEVAWEHGNPAHIAREGATGAFSKYPLTGLDAYYHGRKLYDSIESLIGDMHWAKFSANGGSSWYTPNSGTQGTKLSKQGQPNFHTANPVIDIAGNGQGIAITCVTANNIVCIYINTYRTPMQTENVIFQWDGQNYNLGTCRGSTLYVKTFPKGVGIGLE